MLKEFFQDVLRRTEPHEIETGDRLKKTIVVNGAVEFVECPPPRIAHVLGSISSLVDFLHDASGKGQVFVDSDGATAYLDRHERIDTVKLAAPVTVAFDFWFETCNKGVEGHAAAPTDLVDQLRQVFNIDRHDFFTALEKLDFQRMESASQKRAGHNDSLGVAVENQVQGLEDFATSVTFTDVLVYDPTIEPISRDLTFNVSIDHSARKVRLTVPQDRARMVVRDCAESLAGAIRRELAAADRENIPVLMGRAT